MAEEVEDKSEQSEQGEDEEQEGESGERVNDPLTRRDANAPRTEWKG